MTKLKYFIALMFLCGGLALADETVNLSTPVVMNPTLINTFQVQYLHLNWADSTIDICLTDGSATKNYTYSGTQARNLMVALNKANLTSVSLIHRIFNQLISDGYFQGTVVGTPP